MVAYSELRLLAVRSCWSSEINLGSLKRILLSYELAVLVLILCRIISFLFLWSEQNIPKVLAFLYRVFKDVLLSRTTIRSYREDPGLNRRGICERNLFLGRIKIRTPLNFWPTGYWLVTLVTIKIDVVYRIDKIYLTVTIRNFDWLVYSFKADLIHGQDRVGESWPFTHLCWLVLVTFWCCHSACLLIESSATVLFLRKHFHISFCIMVIGSGTSSLIMKFLISLHANIRRLPLKLLFIDTFGICFGYSASLSSPPLV